VTAAERMFGVIKETLAFAIGAEFFYTLRVGNLLLLNKGCITLTHLARDHHKLRHRVGVTKKAAGCIVLAHGTMTKVFVAVAAEKTDFAVIFYRNDYIFAFAFLAAVFTNYHSSSSL
jgi:hypothetical protein